MWIKGYITALITLLVAAVAFGIVTVSAVSPRWDFWCAMHPRTMDAINFASMGWIIKLVWNE